MKFKVAKFFISWMSGMLIGYYILKGFVNGAILGAIIGSCVGLAFFNWWRMQGKMNIKEIIPPILLVLMVVAIVISTSVPARKQVRVWVGISEFIINDSIETNLFISLVPEKVPLVSIFSPRGNRGEYHLSLKPTLIERQDGSGYTPTGKHMNNVGVGFHSFVLPYHENGEYTLYAEVHTCNPVGHCSVIKETGIKKFRVS